MNAAQRVHRIHEITDELTTHFAELLKQPTAFAAVTKTKESDEVCDRDLELIAQETLMRCMAQTMELRREMILSGRTYENA